MRKQFLLHYLHAKQRVMHLPGPEKRTAEDADISKGRYRVARSFAVFQNALQRTNLTKSCKISTNFYKNKLQGRRVHTFHHRLFPWSTCSSAHGKQSLVVHLRLWCRFWTSIRAYSRFTDASRCGPHMHNEKRENKRKKKPRINAKTVNIFKIHDNVLSLSACGCRVAQGPNVLEDWYSLGTLGLMPLLL